MNELKYLGNQRQLAEDGNFFLCEGDEMTALW